LLRTDTVLLKPTPEQEKKLFYLAEQSSLLWNQANYERRQALFKHKKMPGYATVLHFQDIATLPGYRDRKSTTSVKETSRIMESFWELKKMMAQGKLPHIKKVSPPRYWKDRAKEQTEIKMFCVRNDCYRIKGDTIVLAKDLKVQFAADRIRNGKYGRLDVIYDSLSNRWYAHIPVKVRRPKRPHQPTKHGSIDLGICNIADPVCT
jgi:putative transposase